LSLLVFTLFLACFVFKNKEKKNNEGFLQSEKEESRILSKILILSSDAHNKSSYLSLHHERIQEYKQWKKNSRFIVITFTLHFAQAFCTHSLTRLELARIPSQEGGSSFRNISPTPRVHPSNYK
jgi:hypothetical protein